MKATCPDCKCSGLTRDNSDGSGYCGRCFNIFVFARALQRPSCPCDACVNPGHRLEKARAVYEQAKQTGEVRDVEIR